MTDNTAAQITRQRLQRELHIMEELEDGEASVTALAELLEISRSGAQTIVGALKASGVLNVRRGHGLAMMYSLSDAGRAQLAARRANAGRRSMPVTSVTFDAEWPRLAARLSRGKCAGDAAMTHLAVQLGGVS